MHARLALLLTLAALSGCASTSDFFGPQTRVIGAGESYCTSNDPRVCAALFASMAPLMTPEMTATIRRAQCEAQKELCK